MQPIAEYISVMIAATIKFVGGPIAGMTLGLNILETTLCSAAGMMLTVGVITYGNEVLQKSDFLKGIVVFLKKIALLNIFKGAREYFRKKSAPKKFTKTNRLAVKTKRKMGLWGVALLTPFLLTPVLGTIIALSFRFPKQDIMQKMFVASLIAGLIQTVAVHFVGRIF